MCHLSSAGYTKDSRLGELSGLIAPGGVESSKPSDTIFSSFGAAPHQYQIGGPNPNILWSPSPVILKIVFLALSGVL